MIDRSIGTLLKKNVKNYGMFIALMAVFIFFALATAGTFITPRNLSNLFDQTGYVAVLAIGMTLVLIIRQIDLSVGYACGFIGAIAALLMKNFPGIPVLAVIAVAMIIGLLIGLYQGILVSKFMIPAFVVTMGGMFIFRGLLLRVTEGTGTVIVKNKFFNALGNGFVPSPMIEIGSSRYSLVCLAATALLIIGMIASSTAARRNQQKYNLSVSPKGMFIFKMVFFSALILFFGTELAQFHGLSWTIVIVMVILAIYHFIMNNTTLGRHIYAVGGNPEAAELSGISVKKITMFVFASMGVLVGVAGILFTSRLQSASPAAGNAFEMDAIAASYIGGVSASGGVGKVTGTIIGALVLNALQNGMNLMSVGQSYQYVVRGAVLIIAVLFDVRARRVKI